MDVKAELMGVNVVLNMLERLSVVRPKETVDTSRWLFEGQARQSFVKSSLGCNFDFLSLAVTQEEVLSGHGCVAKEDVFSCN